MDGGDTATRVIDGLLWLRAPAAMLGYLNADPPIMQDGWLCTGDMVDLDGGWMRILGRQSDIINVGGQKVYPSEVESVIGELDDVAQVAVSGESHPILGQIVTASVRPVDIEVVAAKLRIAITTHCARHLERHKIPVRIRITADILTGERHKIMRG
jgi:acyl-CoA synthetase (AMP-forming)/AMP-acid ligase II